ncbi:hypothetical protein VHEMI06133 [[Torrubiella] hemipterigena]|uniref:Serine peptidase n=1 Tax=[Torrubiella] hemipterigena TaxID=1531966 RepID=A0A0A1TKE1_9HYPO|nr:hypothetical protein VHEMI06133 [[Torrubiella] hemipterigena]
MISSMIRAVVAGSAIAGVAEAGRLSVVAHDGLTRVNHGAMMPGQNKADADAYCYGLYPESVPCPIVATTFDQLIDHDKPELGTFKQRVWYNAEFYAGPGAPLLLSTPGEGAADHYQPYTMNQTLAGAYMQDQKGAAIVLEHRYWGDSSPYDTINAKTLQALTLDQSLRDLVYFARNVDLPFTNGTSHPDKSPWTFLGGSYPGALVAYMNKLYPGTFWTYHASSAVVEPIGDYWRYFDPVSAAMPANCSKDWKLAIKQLDTMMDSRDAAGRTALKSKFGLGELADDDFASTLLAPLDSWQGNKFYTKPKDVVLYNLCDYIEGVGNHNENNTVVPGAEGVGSCKALHGLAKYMREVFVPKGPCDGQDWPNGSLQCFNTHNLTSPIYTDRTVRNNYNLQWLWMCCNEPFQHWQASFPGDIGMVSKYYTTQMARDQCAPLFPDTDGFQYGLKLGRTTEQIVEKTTGWKNVNTTRLIYVNGEFDPWRPETVSSDERPGGPLQFTDDVPVFVIKNGTHCADLRLASANANSALAAQVAQMRSIMGKWTAEFYTEKGIKRPGF